jgi:hypothetical protein
LLAADARARLVQRRESLHRPRKVRIGTETTP